MKNLFDIKDKVIIVTGGCGILGKSIANYLAEQGAKIVILDRVEEIGKELEAELKPEDGSLVPGNGRSEQGDTGRKTRKSIRRNASAPSTILLNAAGR